MAGPQFCAALANLPPGRHCTACLWRTVADRRQEAVPSLRDPFRAPPSKSPLSCRRRCATREEASRGRPVELGGEDAPALDGTDPAHKAKVQPRRQVCDIVLRIDKAEPGVTPRTALWWYTMLACLLWSGYAVHGFQKFLHTHNTHTPARRPEISAFHKRECRRLNNTTGMYMLCRG